MRARRPRCASAASPIRGRKVVNSRPSSLRSTQRVFPERVSTRSTDSTLTSASMPRKYPRGDAASARSAVVAQSPLHAGDLVVERLLLVPALVELQDGVD